MRCLLGFFLPILSHCSTSGPVRAETAFLDTDPGAGKATAVVFLSPDCPCSRSHEVGLKELADKHPEIRFIGVYSGHRVENAKKYFSTVRLPFPMTYDDNYQIADEFGALKTPHVFVVGKDRKFLFQGGVDDSHDATRATKFFLASALDAIGKGQNPNPSEVRTLGCYIRQ